MTPTKTPRTTTAEPNTAGPNTAGPSRAETSTGQPAEERSATSGASEPAPLPGNYEAARDELTAVVERLEAGGLSLDESLTWWERGQALAAACEKFLAGARERVEAALAEESATGTADGGPDTGGGREGHTVAP